jgi:hypothetical protein
MRQRLNAPGLARLASDILRAAPLPDDPNARTYEQRMAVKVLSIIEYDREHGTVDRTEEIELFAALFGEEIVKRGGSNDKLRIAALNMVLVDQIRVGVWDEATAAFKALLKAQVHARLARVNPKYLKARTEG